MSSPVIAAMRDYNLAEDSEFDLEQRLTEAKELKEEKREFARDAMHQFLVEAYVGAAEANGERSAQATPCSKHGDENGDHMDCTTCGAAELINGLAGLYKKHLSLSGTLAVVRAISALQEGDFDNSADSVYTMITEEGLAEQLHRKRARWIVDADVQSEEES